MAERRDLKFDSLSDCVRDAEHLLAVGYEQAGKWSLAQCCEHLTHWLTYPVDGFPKPPIFIKPVFWLIRKTSGPGKLARHLKDRSYPAGTPTAPQSVPKPGGDDRAGVAKLKAAVERLMAHTGPIHPSPLFGPMTKQQLLDLQRVHTAHHLSFLVPKTT